MSKVGETGRVSIRIEPGKTGEVMMALRGGVQAYPAVLYDKDAGPIEKDARIWVVEEMGRTLYVTEA